jgi:glycerol-3-phosphate acyltransferase PlsY
MTTQPTQIWLGFRGGRAFSVFLGSLIVINPWALLIWVGWVVIFFLATKYISIAGPLGTLMVGIAFTLFYLFDVTNWSHWSILLVGWGYLLILTAKSIPNFIKISKGELEKGR